MQCRQAHPNLDIRVEPGQSLLETHGIAGTSAKNEGPIISLVIVFTPVTECIAFRVRLPRMVFVAGIVAVVGVCLIVSGDGFVAPTLGDMLVLAAAMARAVHVTAVSALTRGRGYSALTLTLIQSAVCAIVYTLDDYQGVLQAVGAESWPERGGMRGARRLPWMKCGRGVGAADVQSLQSEDLPTRFPVGQRRPCAPGLCKGCHGPLVTFRHLQTEHSQAQIRTWACGLNWLPKQFPGREVPKKVASRLFVAAC